MGTGRIALPLAAAGYDVIGVDEDEQMLDRARLRAGAAGEGGTPLHLVRADMVEVGLAELGPSAAGGARLVILALNSILLLADRDRQRQLFATMAGLLAPGGIAVVDTWLPGVDDLVRFDGRLSLEWLRGDPETGRDVIKLAAAWYDETSRRVTLTTIFDEAEPGAAPLRWTRSDALRLIGADELRSFAEDAGLVVEDVAGDHAMGPFGPGSERVVMVARRPF